MKKLPNLNKVLPVLQPAPADSLNTLWVLRNKFQKTKQPLGLCIKTNHFYKSISLAVNYLMNLLRLSKE